MLYFAVFLVVFCLLLLQLFLQSVLVLSDRSYTNLLHFNLLNCLFYDLFDKELSITKLADCASWWCFIFRTDCCASFLTLKSFWVFGIHWIGTCLLGAVLTGTYSTESAKNHLFVVSKYKIAWKASFNFLLKLYRTIS